MPHPGFNVIGYVSANLGLGAAARTTVRILLENNYPVSVVDIDAGFGRSGSDRSFDHLKAPPGSLGAPYRINLIHLNPPELVALYSVRPPWLFDREKLNVIIPFWELPVVPRSWLTTLERTDLILAPTHFIEHMMATQVRNTAVRHYPQTTFIPRGVTADRAAFGLPEEPVLFITSFEMLSDINRKNAAAALDAFTRAFDQGDNVGLVVKVNNPRPHPSLAPQLERLHALAAANRRIMLWEKNLSYAEVLSLYASCDVLVSLHRSEGLGLSPMEAMLLGKPVIATGWSGNMDFMNDLNSCLVPYRLVSIPDSSSSGYNVKYVGGPTVWADPDIERTIDWMRRLARDPALRTAIGSAAAATMLERHRRCCGGEIFSLVERFFENRTAQKSARAGVPLVGRRRLRVLFQNRANAFEMPGGDTIVMKRLKEQLERKNILVDFNGGDLGQEVRHYDLVHLFNLTLPAITERFAKNAVAQNVPFVVTPLQEDFGRYYHKAVAAYRWFKDYVPAAPERRAALPALGAVLSAAQPVQLITSPFAGNAAGHLCACGETEATLLRAVFGHDRISVVQFGSSIKDLPAPAGLFELAFGVRDFVLCVGRVEPRKNQLLLLYALQESGLPVVFADGGFTYQPEYLDLCKKFPRKGRTVFTGRLTDELLVSAYHACRVHCLPSWYELPGLVSLEAALYGCTVAASSWGCLPDYLGDSFVRCEPDDPADILAAVQSAYDRPGSGKAMELARSFSWEKFGDQMALLYDRVLQEHAAFSPQLVDLARQEAATMRLPDFLERITSLVEQGGLAEALGFYDKHRKSLGETASELLRVDAMMENLRARLANIKR